MHEKLTVDLRDFVGETGGGEPRPYKEEWSMGMKRAGVNPAPTKIALKYFVHQILYQFKIGVQR